MKTSLFTTPRMAAACLATVLCSSLTAQTEIVPYQPVPPQAPITERPQYDQRAADYDASVNLSNSDRAFLEKAARAGMKGLAISLAVAQKLSNAETRDLAQNLATEYGSANTELAAIASRKGFSLPADDTSVASRWAGNTKDVDDEYLEQMKDDHQDAINVFQAGARTEDPEIAAFAQKVLPKLQAQLEQIKGFKKTN